MNGSDLDFSNEDMPLPPSEGDGFFALSESAAPSVPSATPYRVLARKYRPRTFDDLIGQDATVRILRRAFQLGRVAHAFMLTGVRGVGKTTTARIIARALNCVGPDGKGGPTADPCGVCANCTAILADRHPDVLEMDAASRTGVDDVREIIEATRFRPMQARMKVFIIDEVHMLSRNAFNALLKTLEEPPEQVTFIFATTELRKVPVTVLSRCQRFDLRRVPQELLARHFGRIAEKEGARFSDEALALIARAADGSVRDGLSLLDQAIAQGEGEGAACVEAATVAGMLGLADRQLVFDLLDAVMSGRPDVALGITSEAYAQGADLGVMLADLLELLHTISRIKAIPSLRESRELPEAERERGGIFADRLSVATLGRAWQILLKGIEEVEGAPDRRSAAEMVLIRLCHASTLPTPDQLARRLAQGEGVFSTGAAAGALATEHRSDGHVTASGERRIDAGSGEDGTSRAALRLVANGGVAYAEPDAVPEKAPEPMLPKPVAVPVADEVESALPPIRSWREMVAFVAKVAEPILHGILRHSAHLVRFEPPEVTIRMDRGVPPRTEARLQALMERHFPGAWRIGLSSEEGEPTLDEQGAEIVELHRRELHAHPLLQAILKAFPDAKVGEATDASLDEYGLPPEEFDDTTHFGGGDEAPDLEFAPLDADLLDEDDLSGPDGSYF